MSEESSKNNYLIKFQRWYSVMSKPFHYLSIRKLFDNSEINSGVTTNEETLVSVQVFTVLLCTKDVMTGHWSEGMDNPRLPRLNLNRAKVSQILNLVESILHV